MNSRYTEVFRHNKPAFPTLLYTVKQTDNSLKYNLDCFKTLGGLFENIKTKYLTGNKGEKLIYDFQYASTTVPFNTGKALEYMKRVMNVTTIIMKFYLANYIQPEDVAALTNYCFLSQEGSSWKRERVKQRKNHYNTCKGTVQELLQST